MDLAMKHLGRFEQLCTDLLGVLMCFVLFVRLIVCFDGFVFYLVLFVTCLFQV